MVGGGGGGGHWVSEMEIWDVCGYGIEESLPTVAIGDTCIHVFVWVGVQAFMLSGICCCFFYWHFFYCVVVCEDLTLPERERECVHACEVRVCVCMKECVSACVCVCVSVCAGVACMTSKSMYNKTVIICIFGLTSDFWRMLFSQKN